MKFPKLCNIQNIVADLLTMPINITEEPNILINLPNTNFQETLFAGQVGISFCLSKHS